ncbi:efflux RND transporter permease subunit [Klebsiella pneumoniae subsp. pneumoniae]|nr:efflux RND transporter permease subunit [Klebsiella pneumoniae subsp. pneumoniae]
MRFLIVEFARQPARGGLSIIDALRARGATRRFRAVMMTAVSFIIGIMPMMLATGAGAAEPADHRHHGIQRDAGWRRWLASCLSRRCMYCFSVCASGRIGGGKRGATGR